MQERNPEERNQYFKELTRNLNREGFSVSNQADGLLPVAVDDQRLCTVTGSGVVRYWQEDIISEVMSAAMERVIDIAKSHR